MAALTGHPLAIIELGASAGLNLLWDQYRYVYDGDGSFGALDTAVVIRSQFRGSQRPALPALAPPVVGRVGVDLDPIDVRDSEQGRWLQALV